MPRRIVLATGGTAGHVRPALAVAAAYRQHDPQAEIVFVGSSNGFEQTLAREFGYEFELIESLPLARTGAAERWRALQRVNAGAREAQRVLAKHRTEIVLGFGSYPSASTIIAARRQGIATAILECNAVPGLANLLLTPFARLILLGFAECRRYFPHARVAVCGMPLLEGEVAVRERSEPQGVRLLVLGGSQGSPFLNSQVPHLIARLKPRMSLQVLHQTGAGNEAATAMRYRELGVAAQIVPFIANIDHEYAHADFAIACAGASTLAELARHGLPALLVPLAAAAWNHQQANARSFSRRTGVPWVSEREWRIERVADDLAAVLQSETRLAGLAEALRKVASHDAAYMVVSECERLLRP